MKNSPFASRIVASLMISLLLAPTAYSGTDPKDDGDLFMKLDQKKEFSINAKGEDDSLVFGLYNWIGKTDAREDKLSDEQRAEGGWKRVRGKAKKANEGKKWVKKDAVETNDRDPVSASGFAAIQLDGQKYYISQPKDPDEPLSVFDIGGKKLGADEIEKIENQKATSSTLTLRETFLPPAGSDVAGELYGQYQTRLKTQELQLPGRTASEEKGPTLAALTDYAELTDDEIEKKCAELDEKLKSPAPYDKAKMPVTLSRITKKTATTSNEAATDDAVSADNPFYPLQNFNDRRYNKPGKLKIRRAFDPKTKKPYPEDYIFIHSEKSDESEYEILDFPVDQATMNRFFPPPKNVAAGADGNRVLDKNWKLVDPSKDTLFPRTSEEAFCFFREQSKAVVTPTETATPTPTATATTTDSQEAKVNGSAEQIIKDNLGDLDKKIKGVGEVTTPLAEAGIACSQAIKKLKSYSAIKTEYEGILEDPWFVKKSTACKDSTANGNVLKEKTGWTGEAVKALRGMFSNENATRFLKCTAKPSTDDQTRTCVENALFALTWNISTPGQFGSKTQAFIDGFGDGKQSCALFLSLKERFEQMTSAVPAPSDFFRTAFARKGAKADYMKLINAGGACHADNTRINQGLIKTQEGTNSPNGQTKETGQNTSGEVK